MSCRHVLQVADDEIYLVVNAGCREKDLAHINKHLEKFKVGIAMQLAGTELVQSRETQALTPRTQPTSGRPYMTGQA